MAVTATDTESRVRRSAIAPARDGVSPPSDATFTVPASEPERRAAGASRTRPSTGASKPAPETRPARPSDVARAAQERDSGGPAGSSRAEPSQATPFKAAPSKAATASDAPPVPSGKGAAKGGTSATLPALPVDGTRTPAAPAPPPAPAAPGPPPSEEALAAQGVVSAQEAVAVESTTAGDDAPESIEATSDDEDAPGESPLAIALPGLVVPPRPAAPASTKAATADAATASVGDAATRLTAGAGAAKGPDAKPGPVEASDTNGPDGAAGGATDAVARTFDGLLSEATKAAGDLLPPPAAPTQGAAPPSNDATAAAPAAPAQSPAPSAPVPLGAVPMTIGLRSLAGSNRFEIRLDPKDLGRIDVNLDIDKDSGSVTAHLVVDRPETLALLQRDAGNLQQALAQAGFDAGEGAINLSLRGESGSGGQSQAGEGSEGQRSAARGTPASDLKDSHPSLDSVPLRALRGLGGVDIRI